MFKVGDRVRRVGPSVIKIREGMVYTVSFATESVMYLEEIECSYNPKLFELVEEEKIKIPHKHAALIKAWADCPSIELQWRSGPTANWHNFHSQFPPDWSASEIRIKPEPKPDVVITRCVYKRHIVDIVQDKVCNPNVKYTFDGETGKLKSVEMIS